MQCPVEEVGHCVVALDRRAAGGIDGNLDFVTDIRGIGGIQQVEKGISGFLRICDAPELAAACDFGRVADLAAHLGIAGSAVQNHSGAVFDRKNLEHAGRVYEGVVARENRGRGGFDFGKCDDFLFLGGARTGTLGFHEGVESLGIHREAAFARHEFREVEREALFVVEFEREGARNLRCVWLRMVPGSAPAPGAVFRALAGNRIVLSGPKPRVGSIGQLNFGIPWIAADISEFFLQVGFASDQTVKGFLFPDMHTGYIGCLVDAVGSSGFDRLEYFGERIKNGFTVGLFGLDLWLKKKVHMVGHHTCRIEFVMCMVVTIADAFQDDVAFFRSQMPFFACGKSHHVFGPWTLEVGKAAFGVADAGGGAG